MEENGNNPRFYFSTADRLKKSSLDTSVPLSLTSNELIFFTNKIVTIRGKKWFITISETFLHDYLKKSDY